MENAFPIDQEWRDFMTYAIQTVVVVADPPGGFVVHHGWSVWLGGCVIMGGCVTAQGPRTNASLPPPGASSPLSTPPLGGTNCTWLRSISPGASFSSILAVYLSTVCSEKFVVLLLRQGRKLFLWYGCLAWLLNKSCVWISIKLDQILASWITIGDNFFKRSRSESKSFLYI